LRVRTIAILARGPSDSVHETAKRQNGNFEARSGHRAAMAKAGSARWFRRGTGAFGANKGIPVKEWLSLDPGTDRDWLPLAREALDFARGSAR